MNKKDQAHHFLLVALIATLVVVYFIMKPFLGPLILAAIFAFLFQPIYKKIARFFKGHESLASLATTLVAILLVLLPISLLGTQVVKESGQLYRSLLSNGDGFTSSLEGAFVQVRAMLPVPVGTAINIEQYVKQGLELLMQNVGALFSSFTKMLLNMFVFLAAFYFFLKDGNKLKTYLISLSPLDDHDDEFIVSRLKAGVSATIKGNLAIGVAQGALTGIGFALFGVPNAVLWGGVAAFAAFLPGIGTALVIAPAIIFLFITENAFGGTGLLVWGIAAVGLVDNVLGPKLVGRGMELHPLAVFISILGGLLFFGPLGFLLGPLTVSVCLALIDIYASLKTR